MKRKIPRQKSEWLLMVEERAKDIKRVADSGDPKALEWLKKIVLDKAEHPGVRIRALSQMKRFDTQHLTAPLLETIRGLDDSLWLSNVARKILFEKGCISLIYEYAEAEEHIPREAAGKRKA
jgi:hypothetical protein